MFTLVFIKSQRNVGVLLNLRFTKSTAIKPVTVTLGDQIFNAYGAPAAWTLRDDTSDDMDLKFVPPSAPETPPTIQEASALESDTTQAAPLSTPTVTPSTSV